VSSAGSQAVSGAPRPKVNTKIPASIFLKKYSDFLFIQTISDTFFKKNALIKKYIYIPSDLYIHISEKEYE
jgi:hypothetical protein